MRSFNPIRLIRALARRRAPEAPPTRNHPPRGHPPATRYPQPDPTVYADAPLTRLLLAIEHGASDRHLSDLEPALAEYARARRAAGVQPEAMLVEFKRLLRRAIGIDRVRPRLTGRLIELYFA